MPGVQPVIDALAGTYRLLGHEGERETFLRIQPKGLGVRVTQRTNDPTDLTPCRVVDYDRFDGAEPDFRRWKGRDLGSAREVSVTSGVYGDTWLGAETVHTAQPPLWASATRYQELPFRMRMIDSIGQVRGSEDRIAWTRVSTYWGRENWGLFGGYSREMDRGMRTPLFASEVYQRFDDVDPRFWTSGWPMGWPVTPLPTP